VCFILSTAEDSDGIATQYVLWGTKKDFGALETVLGLDWRSMTTSSGGRISLVVDLAQWGKLAPHTGNTWSVFLYHTIYYYTTTERSFTYN